MTVLGASLAASIPWLLPAAACFALAAGARPRGREALALWGLTAATFVARAVAQPALFFHQNGQGPNWIERAFHGVFAQYGPGLFELFHGVIALRPHDPESAVFLLQSLLAAPGPACAWIIARRVGASAPVALVLTAAVAFDPMLARLARSESYFGLGASLLLLATAALSLRATRAPVTRPPFLLATLASAALVAQAARLQPLLCPAAALTPLVLLAGDGSLRRRVRATAVAAAVIGVVSLVAAGPSLWTALHSDLVARLSPQMRYLNLQLLQVTLAVCGLALAGLVGARRGARALPRVALLVVTGVVASLANFPDHAQLKPWIEGGYLRVYAAAMVMALAAATRDIPRTPRQEKLVAALVLALLAGFIAARHARDRTVPTDVLEAELARSWRLMVPPNAQLTWLGQVAATTVRLPVYPDADPAGRVARGLDGVALASDRTLPASASEWYYRSSLCSMPAAVELCAAYERRARLRLVRAWTLPAIESYAQPYATRTVRVALFRYSP